MLYDDDPRRYRHIPIWSEDRKPEEGPDREDPPAEHARQPTNEPEGEPQ